MYIKNGSNQKICVGDTLVGPPRDKRMVLKPGEELVIQGVAEHISIAFVTTPDGLRVAIKEEGLILPWSSNHRIT